MTVVRLSTRLWRSPGSQQELTISDWRLPVFTLDWRLAGLAVESSVSGLDIDSKLGDTHADRTYGREDIMATTDTRATILQIARRLFVQHGFTATTMRQLAREAGIGKATIYHHFADKQAIVLALLEQETGPDVDALAAFESETDPRRCIDMVVLATLEVFQQSMDLIQVVQREVPDGQVWLDAGFRTFWDTNTTTVGAAIAQGQTDGIFRDVDPQQAAAVLMSMVFGLVTSATALNRPLLTPEDEAAGLLDIFLRGIDV
ncbi:MAG TPA: TetR/AcrR family transcriptional regulator [Actinobacteria bacterium]|nr:TetR/AcrR family transcriptional regulator [Actinomycetota bacterium]